MGREADVDSYETPHRIHDIAVYPFSSPNGSNIVIYGHDNGVRIIWRGGRPFRPQSVPEDKSKTNGANADDVMVIDSDDETPYLPSKTTQSSRMQMMRPTLPNHICTLYSILISILALLLFMSPYLTSPLLQAILPLGLALQY